MPRLELFYSSEPFMNICKLFAPSTVANPMARCHETTYWVRARVQVSYRPSRGCFSSLRFLKALCCWLAYS